MGGLAKFPSDAGLKNGLESVEKEKDGPAFGGGGGMGGGNPMGGLFGPQMVAQMALDPRMRPYLNYPDVMSKIQMVQKNPDLLPTILSDPKMMQVLSLLMGGGGAGGGEEFGGEEPPAPTPPSPPSQPFTTPTEPAASSRK